jgi:inorganic phosphate transporter, PiT family
MALAFIADLPTSAAVLFVICLIAVCVFEAINGFHDTANAVATVIYTNTLKPMTAVVWSGLWNFLGAFLGPAFIVYIVARMFGGGDDLPANNIGVAMGIVKLIPLNDLMNQTLGENSALVLAILLAAIAWNFGTWYMGIPSSSSHTLIGSLLGAGFAYWSIHGGAGPNWGKAAEIGLSLLISPVFGFSLTILLMYVLRSFVKKRKEIFNEPAKGKTPPTWIRAILILTCTLVSFFHGSNDGQKGVGLLLVVLMAFMPLQFALNQQVTGQQMTSAARNIEAALTQSAVGVDAGEMSMLALSAGKLAMQIDSTNFKDKNEVQDTRKSTQNFVKSVEKHLQIVEGLPADAKKTIQKNNNLLKSAYEFAPYWAILIISLCLGIGTMVGWKRIVVTIGEKIGKSHLSYAQGASAELCAATTIGLSTAFTLPVSTTHVLSSGIAGSMVASGGIKNLQKGTIKSIALAWLLTLPVSFALGAILFFFLRILF